MFFHFFVQSMEIGPLGERGVNVQSRAGEELFEGAVHVQILPPNMEGMIAWEMPRILSRATQIPAQVSTARKINFKIRIVIYS